MSPDPGAPPLETGYIQTGSGRLFRALHRPPTSPRIAVLLIPPCGDEKRAAYASCVRLARELSTAGAAVLRFDCHGTGDSAGDSAEVTLSGMRRDAELAAGHLRELFPDAPLCLLGVRMGASLALSLAGRLRAARVAAVAPLVSGAAWLRQERGRRQLRRSMVSREMSAAGGSAAPLEAEQLPPGLAEDLDGLPVSTQFARELEEFDLLAAAKENRPAAAPATLIAQISPRRTPLPEIEKLAELCAARVECLRQESFWQPLEPPDLTELAACLRDFLCGEAP